VSTDVSTHLLTIDPEIEDASICSQLNARPTLAAGLLPGGQLLATVCPDGVELWSDLVNGEKVGAWMVQPGQDIVAAQVEEGYIIVAKRGGEVAVLSTKQHQLEHVMWVARCFRTWCPLLMNVFSSATIPAEVSALSMLSNDALPSPIIAVSTWTNEILVYALSDLVASSGVVHTLTENAFASSLLLKLSNSNNTSSTDIQLLAGLSDGGLVVYDLALADVVGGIKELGRKASSLGTRPLRLEPVKVWQGGEENVVAVGLSERMSVIFENKDRLDFSSVSKRVSRRRVRQLMGM
jgi:DNA damage-binding protein 1